VLPDVALVFPFMPLKLHLPQSVARMCTYEV
jgi:hypothetical protein